MEAWLTASPWPGVILWVILYTSDYYLTIYSARGFRGIGHFQFEGSLELTPQFQKEVDALKPVSSLHLTYLVVYSLAIFLIFWITRLASYFHWTYSLFLGMFLLVEVSVHLRHFRNISMIREYQKGGGIEGQISYRKWYTYRVSAHELFAHAALFIFVAVLSFSAFFLGGAIMCFATGLSHLKLARKAKQIVTAPTVVSGDKDAA
jgi:hypothetical protein